MRSKVLNIIICFILILGLTGCGSNTTGSTSNKAKIIDNKGNSVEMTSEELLEIYKENNSKYYKYYLNANIEVTSKIEKVSTGGSCAPLLADFDLIILQGGWKVCLTKGEYDLSELDSSKKLYVKGIIYEPYNEVIMITGKGSKADSYNPSNVELEVVE